MCVVQIVLFRTLRFLFLEILSVVVVLNAWSLIQLSCTPF